MDNKIMIEKIHKCLKEAYGEGANFRYGQLEATKGASQ